MARGEKAARGSLTSSQRQRESGGSVFPACPATQAPPAARSVRGHPHGASQALPQPSQLTLEINPNPGCWWAAVAEQGGGLGSLRSGLSHRKRVEKPRPDPPRPSCSAVPSLGEHGLFSPSVPCPSPPKALWELSGTSTHQHPPAQPHPACSSQRTPASAQRLRSDPQEPENFPFFPSPTPSFPKFNSEQPAAFSLTGLLWLIICVRIN